MTVLTQSDLRRFAVFRDMYHNPMSIRSRRVDLMQIYLKSSETTTLTTDDASVPWKCFWVLFWADHTFKRALTTTRYDLLIGHCSMLVRSICVWLRALLEVQKKDHGAPTSWRMNIILYAWMLVRSICVWLRALLEMQKKRPRSTNFLKDEYNLEFPSVIQGLHFFIKKWNPLNKESCPGRWFAQRPSWMKTHLLRSNECQTDVRGLFRSPQKQVIGSIND